MINVVLQKLLFEFDRIVFFQPIPKVTRVWITILCAKTFYNVVGAFKDLPVMVGAC